VTTTRHLLDLDDAQRPFVETLVSRARQFKAGVPNEGLRLRGRIIVGMFFEPSTRTATSYVVAAQRLGAVWVDFHSEGSSLRKGESLEDTMQTLRAIGADAVVVRHREAGFPHGLARHFGGSVHNAGDGAHAHPSQGLADALTLVEEFGDLKGRRILIVGDVAHSRVARSSAKAAHLLGANVVLCGPPLLLPASQPAWGFAVCTSDFEAALPGADAVIMLRLQTERGTRGELPPAEDVAGAYGLTERRSKTMAPHAIIMHPGPVNRGLELAADLVACERSRIARQVQNGVYVRMAALERTLGQSAREHAA
jgi:aspartate carbamoyltransferase catalytic subunit